jgi:hypothetical protein
MLLSSSRPVLSIPAGGWPQYGDAPRPVGGILSTNKKISPSIPEQLNSREGTSFRILGLVSVSSREWSFALGVEDWWWFKKPSAA